MNYKRKIFDWVYKNDSVDPEVENIEKWEFVPCEIRLLKDMVAVIYKNRKGQEKMEIMEYDKNLYNELKKWKR